MGKLAGSVHGCLPVYVHTDGVLHIPSFVSFLPTGALRNLGFSFKRRGEVEAKGNGRMLTHFLISHGETTVQEPHDDFAHSPILTDPAQAPANHHHEGKADRESKDGNETREKDIDASLGVSKRPDEVEAKGPEVTDPADQQGASGSRGQVLADMSSVSAASESLNWSRIIVPDYSFLST